MNERLIAIGAELVSASPYILFIAIFAFIVFVKMMSDMPVQKSGDYKSL